MDKEQVKKTSEKTDVSPSDIRKLKKAEKKRKKFEKRNSSASKRSTPHVRRSFRPPSDR